MRRGWDGLPLKPARISIREAIRECRAWARENPGNPRQYAHFPTRDLLRTSARQHGWGISLLLLAAGAAYMVFGVAVLGVGIVVGIIIGSDLEPVSVAAGVGVILLCELIRERAAPRGVFATANLRAPLEIAVVQSTSLRRPTHGFQIALMSPADFVPAKNALAGLGVQSIDEHGPGVLSVLMPVGMTGDLARARVEERLAGAEIPFKFSGESLAY